jgi:hypothetical protein
MNSYVNGAASAEPAIKANRASAANTRDAVSLLDLMVLVSSLL